MLAKDELELAFPGTGAPAIGDGPAQGHQQRPLTRQALQALAT